MKYNVLYAGTKVSKVQNQIEFIIHCIRNITWENNKRKHLIIRYSRVLSFFPFLENKVFFGQWVQFGFYPWIQTIYHWLRSDFSKRNSDSRLSFKSWVRLRKWSLFRYWDNKQHSQAQSDGWKMQMAFQSARWCEF